MDLIYLCLIILFAGLVMGLITGCHYLENKK